MAEPDALSNRLRTLEVSVRRLRVALFLLIVGTAVLLNVAAVSHPLPKDARFATLQADKLIVRNHSGDELLIWSSDDVAQGVSIDISHVTSTGKKTVLARLTDFGAEGQLSIGNMDNSRQVMLTVGDIAELMANGAGKGPGIFVRGEGPYVAVQDLRKRLGVLGSVQLAGANGSDIVRPASSVTLFNEHNRVSWSTP